MSYHSLPREYNLEEEMMGLKEIQENEVHQALKVTLENKVHEERMENGVCEERLENKVHEVRLENEVHQELNSSLDGRVIVC